MAESSEIVQGGKGQTDSIIEDLAARMTEVLNRCQRPTPSNDSSVAQIGWHQLCSMVPSCRDVYLRQRQIGFFNGELPQPSPTDPTFRQWRTEDSIVKGWLRNSMDRSLIGNFVRLPTAKMVWDSVAKTYFDGSDTSQVYELRRRVTRASRRADWEGN